MWDQSTITLNYIHKNHNDSSGKACSLMIKRQIPTKKLVIDYMFIEYVQITNQTKYCVHNKLYLFIQYKSFYIHLKNINMVKNNN